MNPVSGVNAVLTLLNLLIPAGANIITLIFHKDGTKTAVMYLDEADAQFAANQKQIADWVASHKSTA